MNQRTINPQTLSKYDYDLCRFALPPKARPVGVCKFPINPSILPPQVSLNASYHILSYDPRWGTPVTVTDGHSIIEYHEIYRKKRTNPAHQEGISQRSPILDDLSRSLTIEKLQGVHTGFSERKGRLYYWAKGDWIIGHDEYVTIFLSDTGYQKKTLRQVILQSLLSPWVSISVRDNPTLLSRIFQIIPNYITLRNGGQNI